MRATDTADVAKRQRWTAPALPPLEVLTANAGSWQLRVQDGRGSVEPGGPGSLRIDVRALASLFTGFADPWTLAQTGRLEGTPEDLRAAAAVFAGPLPWMREMF